MEEARQRTAQWPTDEKGIEDWLNTMPLLSTSVPEENAEFSAIQDLVNETSPDEVLILNCSGEQ